MTIELKITASTAAELGEHVSSLALMFGTASATPTAQLNWTGTPTDPVMPEVKTAEKAARTRKAAEEPKAVEPQPEPEPEPEPTAEDVKEDPEPSKEEAAQADPEPVSETLDFTKDVMPLMFSLTEKQGRDAVVAVVGKFGVAKGSQVPADKLGEFAAELKKAIGR